MPRLFVKVHVSQLMLWGSFLIRKFIVNNSKHRLYNYTHKLYPYLGQLFKVSSCKWKFELKLWTSFNHRNPILSSLFDPELSTQLLNPLLNQTSIKTGFSKSANLIIFCTLIHSWLFYCFASSPIFTCSSWALDFWVRSVGFK